MAETLYACNLQHTAASIVYSSICPVAMLFCYWHDALLVAGHKEQLQWFRSYIAAVLSTPGQQDLPSTCVLQVFDLRNKLIAISVPLNEVCLSLLPHVWSDPLLFSLDCNQEFIDQVGHISTGETKRGLYTSPCRGL